VLEKLILKGIRLSESDIKEIKPALLNLQVKDKKNSSVDHWINDILELDDSLKEILIH